MKEFRETPYNSYACFRFGLQASFMALTKLLYMLLDTY